MTTMSSVEKYFLHATIYEDGSVHRPVIRGTKGFDQIYGGTWLGGPYPLFYVLEKIDPPWPKHAHRYALTCRNDALWAKDASQMIGRVIKHRDLDVAITHAVMLAGRGVTTLRGST